MQKGKYKARLPEGTKYYKYLWPTRRGWDQCLGFFLASRPPTGISPEIVSEPSWSERCANKDYLAPPKNTNNPRPVGVNALISCESVCIVHCAFWIVYCAFLSIGRNLLFELYTCIMHLWELVHCALCICESWKYQHWLSAPLFHSHALSVCVGRSNSIRHIHCLICFNICVQKYFYICLSSHGASRLPNVRKDVI